MVILETSGHILPAWLMINKKSDPEISKSLNRTLLKSRAQGIPTVKTTSGELTIKITHLIMK